MTNELNNLRAAIASLVSAKANEFANETRLVIDAMNAVKAAAAGRTSREDRSRFDGLMNRALSVVNQRRAA